MLEDGGGRDGVVEAANGAVRGEPFAQDFRACCPQCLRSKTRSDLAYVQARFWQSLHQRALKREAVLKEKVEDLEAKLRARERQLFGKKSERGRGSEQSEDGKEGKQREEDKKETIRRG